jgi:acetylglutamate kinase
MPTLTRYMVQAYKRGEGGDLIADEPLKFHCPIEARERLDDLAGKRAGVVAYSWTGDMRTGETGKISLLSQSGSLPVYAAIALGIEHHAA